MENLAPAPGFSHSVLIIRTATLLLCTKLATALGMKNNLHQQTLRIMRKLWARLALVNCNFSAHDLSAKWRDLPLPRGNDGGNPVCGPGAKLDPRGKKKFGKPWPEKMAGPEGENPDEGGVADPVVGPGDTGPGGVIP